MNGMDMMVNAVLKATGFVREDFDKGVATAKTKVANFEARFLTMESNLVEILSILRNMHASNSTPAQLTLTGAADVREPDHAD